MASRLICVFPGQGSQFVGMGKDLWASDTDVQALYQEANEALGYDLQRLCFEGPEEKLRLTQHTQPAMLVHSLAVWTLLRKRGCQPLYLAGHSLGEYSALVAADGLAFADAVRLVHQRGLFMQEAVPVGRGSMAAMLGMERQTVEALCAEFAAGGVLQPANYNAPGQIVVAGETALVQAAVQAAKERQLGRTRLLNVSAPFHCAMLQSAADRLRAAFAAVTLQPLTIPVLSNVTAAPHVSPQTMKTLLIRQVCAPVRWEESMQYAVTQGCDTLLEVGPGSVLGGLMRRIAPQVAIGSLDDILGRSDREGA